jgi:peroxiredoxin
VIYPNSVNEYLTLPANLPVPEDDGAARHLPGLAIPALVLDSSHGPVDLAQLCTDRAVIYIYPHTGIPGEPLLEGWDAFPGARGCTPESCGFRDLAAELAAAGARVAGLSGQPLAEQIGFAERNGMPFPVIADPHLRLRAALALPTFELHGVTFLRRLTLVAEHGTVAKAFYPVFPPDRHAGEVLAWLERRGPLEG